ncbi:MAG: metallophosphoesterase [Myxococcota bacterium]
MWLWIQLGTVAVSVLVSFYLGFRVAGAFRLQGVRKAVLVAAFLGIGPVTFVGVKTIAYTPACWSFAVAVLLAMVSSAAILGVGRALLLRRSRGDKAHAGDDAEGEEAVADEGRRDALIQLGTTTALGVGVGVGGYSVVFAPSDYDVVELPLPIAGLSPALDGYQIAQLSDIHFGTHVGEPERRAMVELVARIRPDMVVLTGDLVDHDPAHVPELGRLIRDLSSLGLRDGVVAIPGNHDHYTGVDEVLRACRHGGARVLRNDGVIVEDAFALLGVDYGAHADFARAIREVDSVHPRILLAHDPMFFPEVRGQVAAQLSGHTHGGQLAPFGVSPADLFLPYVRGLYVEEGSQLYVNRGFGTAVAPARIGCPPELTRVTLVAV